MLSGDVWVFVCGCVGVFGPGLLRPAERMEAVTYSNRVEGGSFGEAICDSQGCECQARTGSVVCAFPRLTGAVGQHSQLL